MPEIKKVYYYEKKPNYTEAQEREIKRQAPHNLASAKLLAMKWKKSVASVVAKIKQMEIHYISDKTINPPTIRHTREDIVVQIEQATGLTFSKTFERRVALKDLKMLRDYIDKQKQLI